MHDSIKRSREGIRAVSLSLAVLGLAAIAQTAVFVASGSIALLADLIHNFGDALTAVPLVVTLQGETLMDDADIFDTSQVLRTALRAGIRTAAARRAGSTARFSRRAYRRTVRANSAAKIAAPTMLVNNL